MIIKSGENPEDIACEKYLAFSEKIERKINKENNKYLFNKLNVPKKYEEAMSACSVTADSISYKSNLNGLLIEDDGWDLLRYIWRNPGFTLAILGDHYPFEYENMYVMMFDNSMYNKRQDTYEEYVVMPGIRGTILKNFSKDILSMLDKISEGNKNYYISDYYKKFSFYINIKKKLYWAVSSRKNISGWVIDGRVKCNFLGYQTLLHEFSFHTNNYSYGSQEIKGIFLSDNSIGDHVSVKN